MTPLIATALSVLMIGTAFLSGIFGMAGGLILIGVLLALFPVSTAMILHAVTQMASNGWRAILRRRHVRWPSLIFYLAGCLAAVPLWSVTLYVPSKPMALMLLTGVTGPLLDTMFLRSPLDRRSIIATKAICREPDTVSTCSISMR